MCLYSTGTTESHSYTLKQLFQPSPLLASVSSSSLSSFVTLALKGMEYYSPSRMGIQHRQKTLKLEQHSCAQV